jgi:hypothetical protein
MTGAAGTYSTTVVIEVNIMVFGDFEDTVSFGRLFD